VNAIETALQAARVEREKREEQYARRAREESYSHAQIVKNTIGAKMWFALMDETQTTYSPDETYLPFSGGTIRAVHDDEDGLLTLRWHTDTQPTNVRCVLRTNARNNQSEAEMETENRERLGEFLLKATEWKPEDEKPKIKEASQVRMARAIGDQRDNVMHIRRSFDFGADVEAAICQAKATLLVAEALMLLEERISEAGQ